jgi:3'(2'), 5'-bisphosphate nucleotidase
MPLRDLDQLARQFGTLASQAGAAILDVASRGISMRTKADASPVTAADEVAEATVLTALARLLPGVPVIAEECVARGEVPAIGDIFVLVDALDGTREFIAGRNEYTVNIALIHKGVPVCGAIYAPATSALYIGAGHKAYRAQLAPGGRVEDAVLQPIRTIAPLPGGLRALASRSHNDPDTQAYLDSLQISERVTAGSSLKFCVLAEGKADIYPRLFPIMEWDVAAGHAIVSAAGGCVRTPQGGPLVYGKADKGFRHVPFVAWGKCEDTSGADRPGA